MIMNHIQIRGKSAADDGKEVLHFELGSTRDILVTMLNRKKKKTHRVSSLAAPGGAGFRRDTGQQRQSRAPKVTTWGDFVFFDDPNIVKHVPS